MRRVLLFCSLLLMSEAKKANEVEVNVMRALSANFGKMVLECKAELEIKQNVINDLLDFWNEKNNLTSEDLGCALVCVFEKNDFLSPDTSKVQEDNVLASFKAFGADDVLSSRLVNLLKLCRRLTSSIKDLCTSALEMAKCFRYGIFTMSWNPDRFYWKHSPPPKYMRSYDTNGIKGMTEPALLTKLFRTCRN